MNSTLLIAWCTLLNPEADPGFQVRGAYLKKSCRAEGGTQIFWVFRVKNHDFTPKNHIFSNFRGRAPGAPPLKPSVIKFVSNLRKVGVYSMYSGFI